MSLLKNLVFGMAARSLWKLRVAALQSALSPREKRQCLRMLFKIRDELGVLEHNGAEPEPFVRFLQTTITRSLARMKSTITLTINGSAVRFDMTPEIYNKYVDEIQTTKKVGPTQNLLMRAVHSEDKEALKSIIKMPGATMQIGSMLIEQYSPDIEITVGE